MAIAGCFLDAADCRAVAFIAASESPRRSCLESPWEGFSLAFPSFCMFFRWVFPNFSAALLVDFPVAAALAGYSSLCCR